MEQRDYLMDQVEQLGRVLGKILADLLHLKGIGQINQGIETAKVSLQEKLDFEDLQELILLPNEQFIIKLSQLPYLNPLGLEHIADILYEIGLERGQNQRSYLEKSLAIYDYLMHRTRTFALDWTEKIERMKDTLQSLNTGPLNET